MRIASLPGYTSNPFTVVWGNPLTIQGWDEGVPYDQLFPDHPAEAVIGGVSLFMQAAFAGLGFYLLRRLSMKQKLTSYVMYLFVVVNMTELVAYILMCPFAGNGDTGRFNEGFRLSPWLLFVLGTVLLCLALKVLLRTMMPRLDHVMGWPTKSTGWSCASRVLSCFYGEAASASWHSTQTANGNGVSLASSAF